MSNTEKIPFYKKDWLMWVCLVLCAPLGIVIMWAFHKEKTRGFKIFASIAFAILFALVIGYHPGTEANTDATVEPTTSISTTASQIHYPTIPQTTAAAPQVVLQQGEDGNWYAYSNGAVDYSYNGQATNEYGTWNVVNGQVVFG